MKDILQKNNKCIVRIFYKFNIYSTQKTDGLKFLNFSEFVLSFYDEQYNEQLEEEINDDAN